MTTPAYRALCAELAGCLDDALTFTVQGDTERSMRQLITRARTLLAAPDAVGELQWPASVAQGCHEAAAEAEPGSPMQQLLVAAGDLLEHLGRRAPEVVDPIAEFVAAQKPLSPESAEVLSPENRWDLYESSAPATEAVGEVEELVAALEADADCAEAEHYDLCNMTAEQMRLAAALLRQLAHPAPVPVGERLPGVDDCLVQNTGPDDEPEWWCWFYRPGLEGTAEWRWNTTPQLSEWYGWQGVTYWLPHWALPLPEAQP